MAKERRRNLLSNFSQSFLLLHHHCHLITPSLSEDMSEFPLSSTEECLKRKKLALSSLLLSDFHLFFSFVLSHPLYFSYVLFFSPYIFKILSFLSPLFLTTTLLLLALLSTLHVHDACSDSVLPESQPSLFFSSYSKLGGVLRTKVDVNDEDHLSLEELEAYKMVFETCPPETVSESELGETCSTTEQAFVDKFCSHESTVSEALWEETNEEPVEVPPSKTEIVMNLEEEIVKCEKGEEEVKPLSGTVPNKDEGDNWEMPTTMESKAQKVGVDENGNNNEERDLPKLSHFLGKISVDKDENGGERENADSPKSNGEISLGSLGSMRKEKEWRRTLACKLFEERHNVAGEVGGGGRCGGGEEGGERMDLLWEAYESQTDKTPLRSEEKKKQTTKKKEKQKKKSKNIEEIYKDEAHYHHHDDGDDNDNDDDDGDGDGDEQLCCLHALKFSTGKMHLGIARPNFLKLSKAFKGFGRFHSVSKHSKKT